MLRCLLDVCSLSESATIFASLLLLCVQCPLVIFPTSTSMKVHPTDSNPPPPPSPTHPSPKRCWIWIREEKPLYCCCLLCTALTDISVACGKESLGRRCANRGTGNERTATQDSLASGLPAQVKWRLIRRAITREWRFVAGNLKCDRAIRILKANAPSLLRA